MAMKVFLETFGCQMNASDSELIRTILQRDGFDLCGSVQEADVFLVNTCAIRENAHRKIFGLLDRLRPHRKQKPDFVVGVLGCMAQNLKEELFDHPVVNLVIGPDNYRSLPRYIARAARSGSREMEATLSEYETYSDIAPARVEGVNAWIAVMRGCDNFCSFCVVPYTRGRERSRPLAGVLEEARALVAQGYRQVTLLGQNVNSYRDGAAEFADLIAQVADLPGMERVRFTSPHPKDFPPPLLEAIAGHPNICKHVHLPLQSGSDRILDRMNRTYTEKEFLDLSEQIRRMIPDVALTTDVIVGFPTETEEDFGQTVRVIRRVRFDNAFMFKYSPRQGTIASRKYPDDVPPGIKTDRIVLLQKLQRQISQEKNRARTGQIVTVLIEGPADRTPGHQMGKSDGNGTVIFPESGHSRGTLVPVKILEATANTLYGMTVPEPVPQDA